VRKKYGPEGATNASLMIPNSSPRAADPIAAAAAIASELEHAAAEA
jgi:hypothetical protein